MKILGVPKETLSVMVKDGLIRVSADPADGRCYIYNDEDVQSVCEAREKTGKRRPPKLGPAAEEICARLGYDLEELRHGGNYRQLADRRRILAILLKRRGYTHQEMADFMCRTTASVSSMLRTAYLVEKEADAAEMLLE